MALNASLMSPPLLEVSGFWQIFRRREGCLFICPGFSTRGKYGGLKVTPSPVRQQDDPIGREELFRIRAESACSDFCAKEVPSLPDFTATIRSGDRSHRVAVCFSEEVYTWKVGEMARLPDVVWLISLLTSGEGQCRRRFPVDPGSCQLDWDRVRIRHGGEHNSRGSRYHYYGGIRIPHKRCIQVLGRDVYGSLIRAGAHLRAPGGKELCYVTVETFFGDSGRVLGLWFLREKLFLYLSRSTTNWVTGMALQRGKG